jgi:flagellar basal-body rod protein FlgG
VNIDEYGQIFLNNEILDTLDVVSFENMEKLEKTGNNLFIYAGDTADEITLENVRVQAGSLEQANVQVVEEMAKMIDYQRMFETYTKSIKTFDEIDSKAINEVGLFT